MSHRKIRISLDNGRTWVEVDSGPPQIETEVSFELNPPDQSEVTGCQVHLGSADDTWEDTAALSSGEPIQWTPGEGEPVHPRVLDSLSKSRATPTNGSGRATARS